MIRTVFTLDNEGKLDSYYMEKLNFSAPFSMFVKDNEVNINSNTPKVTKGSMLTYIEGVARSIDAKLSGWEEVMGINTNLMKQLEKDFSITKEELKEAINNGRNRNKRRHYFKECATTGQVFRNYYIAGSEPGVYHESEDEEIYW